MPGLPSAQDAAAGRSCWSRSLRSGWRRRWRSRTRRATSAATQPGCPAITASSAPIARRCCRCSRWRAAFARHCSALARVRAAVRAARRCPPGAGCAPIPRSGPALLLVEPAAVRPPCAQPPARPARPVTSSLQRGSSPMNKSFRPWLAGIACVAACSPAGAPPSPTNWRRCGPKSRRSSRSTRTASRQLEARIEQLESARASGRRKPDGRRDGSNRSRARPTGPTAAAAVDLGWRVGVQSLHLGDPDGDLRQPVAGSRRPGDRRLHAGGGEIGPGERSFSLGESEITFAASVDPYFSASLTAALVRRGRARRRGSLRPHHGAARRLLGQGRPFLLGHRLPERDPRPRLGLRRPAAGLPGVLRRPVRAGRRAGEVARADRPVPRVRRRGRQWRCVPRHARDGNGLNGIALFAHVGWRPRRFDRLARGPVMARRRMRRSAATRTSTPRATRSRTPSPGSRRRGSRMRR